MSRIFLSYRHEDDAHRARVRDLALRLEKAGVEAVLDQLEQDRMFHSGGPNEGWPRWSKSQAGDSGNKVLIVASEGWFRCYEGKELPGSGLGAAAEAGVIEQRLYNCAGVSADIRIVTFGRIDPQALPLDLQRYHCFADPGDFTDLVCWITGSTPATAVVAVAAAEWPETPPPLLWVLADQDEVRDALERLLTRAAPWQFLPLRGPSEAGKSQITKQILGNALRMAGLACGRFDFKGTNAIEAELQAFVQHLGVAVPSGSGSLSDKLAHVLAELRRAARPALLIFDTYEAASGEAQDWIEKQILPALIRERWLRVIIAGQRVPERAGASWESAASSCLVLKPPQAEHWFEFGQLHKSGLTLEFVRQVHQLSGGRPSLLAQLLGPTN